MKTSLTAVESVEGTQCRHYRQKQLENLMYCTFVYALFLSVVHKNHELSLADVCEPTVDSETSVEVDFEDDDDDDDDENTVTVTTPVGNGKKSGSKKRPSRKMSPGKNGVEKVERRANRVCLVNDFSRFDELVRNGRNVVAVRRFNKNLVEITQAMTTKTSSSKATVTTTRIPRDIKKLCNITEKDLDVITDDVQVSPGVLRFTFSSDNGVPDEKETLRGVCTQVFGRSINGLMESCVDAVGSA